MDLTFLYSAGFVREWKHLGLTDSDLEALEEVIANAPEAAPVMRGAGGLRKIRFAPPSTHQGKSGAMRVGFAYFVSKAVIIVVAIFAKNDAANFTTAEKTEIATWLKTVERNFK